MIKLSEKDCERLDTPKPDRPWIVVQANQVKDSLDLMICPMTSTHGKRELSSFELVKSGEILSAENKPYRKESFVKCARICTVESLNVVEYVGFVLPQTMARIDAKLRFCLDLPLPKEKKAPAVSLERKRKTSYRLVSVARRTKEKQEKQKPQQKPSYRLARGARRKK